MPRVRDNYFLKNAVYYRLKPRVKHYAGGRAIVVPLNFDKEGGGGQWWAGADKMDIRIRNTINASIYYRKNYSVACVVDRDEEDSVRGDTAIASLMDQKMNTCERTAVDAVGTGLFNAGTDPKAVTGLQYALTPYTGGAPGTMPSIWSPRRRWRCGNSSSAISPRPIFRQNSKRSLPVPTTRRVTGRRRKSRPSCSP